MTTPDEQPWGIARRLAFRFVVPYFVAYTLLNGNASTLPLALIAPHGEAPAWYGSGTNAVWTASARLFGIAGPIRALDNGDSVGDHVALLCFALVSALVAAIWSLRARDRLEHRHAFALLHVGARYVLAFTVFAYAIFKVFPAQFSLPSPSRLVTTYGASSRMGLLWTFMGASPAYQMIAGFAELGGCVLLLARRTATLGALVVLGVLGNVFLMDLFYDVPAKLCVLHLLGMAVLVMLPDAARLADVLVRSRGAAPRVFAPRSPRLVAAKIGFVALVVYVEGVPVRGFYYTERDGAPLPPLYGAYEVEELRRAGEVVPPSLDDPAYLRIVTVDRRRVNAFLTDGSRAQGAALSVTRVDDERVAAVGTYQGAPVAARAHRLDPKKELLVRQPVRWFLDAPDIR